MIVTKGEFETALVDMELCQKRYEAALIEHDEIEARAILESEQKNEYRARAEATLAVAAMIRSLSDKKIAYGIALHRVEFLKKLAGGSDGNS